MTSNNVQFYQSVFFFGIGAKEAMNVAYNKQKQKAS